MHPLRVNVSRDVIIARNDDNNDAFFVIYRRPVARPPVLSNRGFFTR